jgi:uncharacterized protein (TIGR03435 family)
VLARFLLISAACCSAQTFEVASIKPATPLGPLGGQSDQKGGPGTSDPGMFSCRNCSLYWVLGNAFPMHGYDFSGPDWLQSTRFDFAAKIPAGASDEDFQRMLRNLFAERFKMTSHHETRQMELYEMTVGKGGPKFHESTPKDDSKHEPSGPPKRDADGFPILTHGMSMAIVPGHARLQSENQSMAWLAGQLGNQLRSPVRDATGLTANYDFMLSWSWDEGPGAQSAGTADLVNQLPVQLGLKLERKKGPVEVLVVDHMEKTPTEN